MNELTGINDSFVTFSTYLPLLTVEEARDRGGGGQAREGGELRMRGDVGRTYMSLPSLPPDE